jgi:hypothetical protein
MKKKRVSRGIRRLIVLLVVLAFISINVLAWMQARSMTHFAAPGTQMPAIEALSLGERLQLAALGVPVPRPANQHTPADAGYPYEIYRIDLPHNEWLEGWLITHPQPRGIVLLFHGYAASKQQVLLPAQVWYEMGYTTFLVDFRGSGGSSGSTTTLGLREAEDVAHAVAFVRQQWPGQPVLLYSTSMGSSAVLRAVAVEGVHADAIIAENPFDRLSSAVSARFRLMGLPTFPTAELLVFWGGVQHGYNAFTHNPVDYARSIHSPTLLLRGAEDTRVSAAEVEAIYQALQGPKEQISVPAVGHTLLLTQTPDVQRQVEQFLELVGHRGIAHDLEPQRCAQMWRHPRNQCTMHGCIVVSQRLAHRTVAYDEVPYTILHSSIRSVACHHPPSHTKQVRPQEPRTCHFCTRCNSGSSSGLSVSAAQQARSRLCIRSLSSESAGSATGSSSGR